MMMEGLELAAASQNLKRLAFKRRAVTRDCIDDLRRKHEIATINPASVALWLFDETTNRCTVKS